MRANKLPAWHARARELAAVEPRMSTAQIAAVVGVTTATVCRWFTAQGIRSGSTDHAAAYKQRGKELQVINKLHTSCSHLHAHAMSDYSRDPSGIEVAYATKPLPPHMTGDAIVARLRERIQAAAQREKQC